MKNIIKSFEDDESQAAIKATKLFSTKNNNFIMQFSTIKQDNRYVVKSLFKSSKLFTRLYNIKVDINKRFQIFQIKIFYFKFKLMSTLHFLFGRSSNLSATASKIL